MYCYITGTITEKNDNYVVVETNGFGYLIYVSNPSTFMLNEVVKLYLYHLIKESEQCFYGFKDKIEQSYFIKLLGVKGLGPKMAMAILSSGTTEDLENAINSSNTLYFKSIPKIGDKLANEIILNLKKIKKTTLKNNETIEALIALGYKQSEIVKIINKIDDSQNVSHQIKEALKLLSEQ